MRTHVRLAMAVVVAIGGRAFAATPDATAELRVLQAEMQAQQSVLNSQSKELSGLRSDQGQTWLTAARAEQVKSLVREVLSDADTRASLMDSAITAGHNGKNFFLASEDGNFLLTVDGQIQVRYIWNRIEDTGSRNYNEGFQLRRAKLAFRGHVYDPKLTYGLRIVNDYTSGSMSLEEAWAAYDVADGWNVKGGQFKAPFLHEVLVDDRYQLAVERSIVADVFKVGYTQGVQLSYTADMFRFAAMVHDGSNAANSDYTLVGTGSGGSGFTPEAEIAFAARGELKLMGDWDQFNDFTTWSTDSTGVMLGAAIDYENAEGDTGSVTEPDMLKWTVDASAEVPSMFGFNAYAAFVGAHSFTREHSAGDADMDNYGLVVQAAVFVVPDKWELFGRYEWFDLQGDIDSNDVLSRGQEANPQFLTLGTNYYMHKHGSKFTLDVVWVMNPTDGLSDTTDGVNFPNTGSALLNTGRANEVSIRAQYQLLF
ncbi:MAG: porin [Phycisphaerales bacterium]